MTKLIKEKKKYSSEMPEEITLLGEKGEENS